MATTEKCIKNPSIDIDPNFPHDGKDACYRCYNDIIDIYKSSLTDNPNLSKNVDIDIVDSYSDGWYFNIRVSLSEKDFIQKVVNKILEYNI